MTREVEREMEKIAPWLGSTTDSATARELGKAHVKAEKIRAKAEVQKARAESDGYLLVKFLLAVCCVVIVLIGGCTYDATRPVDPTDQKIKQEKYELCMQVEKKYDECKYADE